MSEIDQLPPLRDVIRAHDLRAEKSLGQNFLLDLNLTAKIAKAAGDLTNFTVFEIGPGPGGLTRALLNTHAKQVIAVEYDPRAVAALQDLKAVAGPRFTVLHQDALKSDLLTLVPPDVQTSSNAIVANLPYNIATPLLTGWLAQIRARDQAYQTMVLMFQKEVAQRIVAQPSTKAYGRLSIISQWLCDCKLMFDVPPSAFTPPPKITSSIVRFKARVPLSDWPPFEVVETITAAAFGQRRKMIRSSLKAYLPEIEACGIDPQKRAEDLAVDDYIRLAQQKMKTA